MPYSRPAACVALLWAALVTNVFALQDPTGSGSEVLDRAIRLFEEGSYVEAQELLTGLDRESLTPDAQALRDDYLGRIQVALTMYEKALRDLEDAEQAITDHDSVRARTLLQRVLDNEYAAEALRRAASNHLKDLDSQHPANEESAPPTPAPSRVEAVQAISEPPPPPSPSETGASSTPAAVPPPEANAAQARTLIRQGQEAYDRSDFGEATRRYTDALNLVPGHPDAVEGLRRVELRDRQLNDVTGESLADRLRREDAIAWQRTEIQFRDAEREAREQVRAERFEEANRLVIRARQILEAGKQFADPLADYQALRESGEELARFVRDQEREYHERKVAETRREVEAQRAARLRQVEESRRVQVDALMEQARKHRQNGDLDQAVNALRQVTVIDPKYAPARWLMDELEDQRQYREAHETREVYYEKSRGALDDVERAKIPWFEELKYPDSWPELISRPTRSRPGQGGTDSLLLGSLDRPTSVDFQRTPFQEAMERLADAQGVNLIVNWGDLGRAGVKRDVPIDLQLPHEVSLSKVLTELLNQAGDGVELGYEVSDGAVTIATRSTLDKETFPRIYDVTDLLVDVPNLTDVPSTDLQEVTRQSMRTADASGVPWNKDQPNDQAEEPEEDPHRLERMVKLMDLIRDTVAPGSWRDQGGTIGSMREINAQLVVTQNAAAHRQITGLLDRLRQERAIQVSVEALFITVSSHYLEQMGMDLDVVFNSGNAGFDFLDSGSGAVTDPVLGTRLLLPRSFSRLGFTQNVPAQGTALATPGGQVVQPFTQPFLVPQHQGGGGSRLTPVPVTSGTLDLTDTANLPSDVPGSFGGQRIPPALNITGSFLDNIQVDFLIRATQADSRTSVVTAPRLVVFNGGSAWIAVTIQQNFISQLQPVAAQGAVAQAPLIGTINAGASLFVRATVTADKRYVMMLLSPGVTRLLDLQTFQFSGGTGANQAFIQLPTLSSQRIQTMVSVPDGGTLLIGGQKLASETEVEAGVPILSKIPILKRAYSSRSLVKDEQTLLILIKPKILIHSEQEELSFPGFTRG